MLRMQGFVETYVEPCLHMEAVVLDHITAILYIGRWSAGEGLTEEEGQACIDYFSPYIEWRDIAIEYKFQALTLAEAREAYEA